MGWQKPHEIQQELQSPAAGEEQPQVPLPAGGCAAEKQLCRKGRGGVGGYQVDHALAMCLCGKEGTWYPEQQFEGGDPSSLSTDKAILEVMCPDLGSLVQKKQGYFDLEQLSTYLYFPSEERSKIWYLSISYMDFI